MEGKGVDDGGTLVVNRRALLDMASSLLEVGGLEELRGRVGRVIDALSRGESDLLDVQDGGECVELGASYLVGELRQIEESLTLERARYYLERLVKAITEVKTSPVNDINLHRWKEYDEIITDSLWNFPRRDTSGAHLGWYWGNFIPQIPRQMMLRYTRKGEWVLDPFVGSGTTLIECRRLGRNGLGVELNPDVAGRARRLVGEEPNPAGIRTEVMAGDAARIDVRAALEEVGAAGFQLLVMHPPYHDIIRFGDDPRDLSCAPTVDDFLGMLGGVLDNVCPFHDGGRYLALVIGDKYSGGEWIPLGFYCMQEVQKRGYGLKSIVVKNFEETRAKRRQKELWRYRALVGGFYVFKHEYVMVFRKKAG